MSPPKVHLVARVQGRPVRNHVEALCMFGVSVSRLHARCRILHVLTVCQKVANASGNLQRNYLLHLDSGALGDTRPCNRDSGWGCRKLKYMIATL